MRPGRGQRMIEHTIVELPALDRATVLSRARLPVRVRPVVGVIVPAKRPVHCEPGERFPVGVDVREVATGLSLQLVGVQGIERIVEAPGGRERGRSRVGEAPRAMQGRWTTQVLLGVEVRRLPQRADADAVDRVAAVRT